MSFWEQIYTASIHIFGADITWREIIGNAFGMASALGGLKRRVWAWPVGIIGNVLLFTVFAGLAFGLHDRAPMFGQAGRQILFVAASLYGWWSWRKTLHAGGASDDEQAAVNPHWATSRQRIGYLFTWGFGVIAAAKIFAVIGAGWPAPSWYYWTDAWVFIGSFLATYSMARGWNDFWLMWIAVDAVGLPALIHARYYPSAMLYGIYGILVLYGFITWVRIHRKTETEKLAYPG